MYNFFHKVVCCTLSVEAQKGGRAKHNKKEYKIEKHTRLIHIEANAAAHSAFDPHLNRRESNPDVVEETR